MNLHGCSHLVGDLLAALVRLGELNVAHDGHAILGDRPIANVDEAPAVRLQLVDGHEALDDEVAVARVFTSLPRGEHQTVALKAERDGHLARFAGE